VPDWAKVSIPLHSPPKFIWTTCMAKASKDGKRAKAKGWLGIVSTESPDPSQVRLLYCQTGEEKGEEDIEYFPEVSVPIEECVPRLFQGRREVWALKKNASVLAAFKNADGKCTTVLYEAVVNSPFSEGYDVSLTFKKGGESQSIRREDVIYRGE
jgi:hypothetical protein